MTRQRSLVDDAAAGDTGAQERLVRNHRHAIVDAARARGGGSLGFEDLVQEGMVGFLGAIQSFGGRPSGQFEAYATECIRRQMDTALADEQTAVENTSRVVEDANSFDHAEYVLAGELQRKPTSAEIAKRLHWTEERTQAVAELVEEARRRHDEELLQYLDPDLDPAERVGSGER